MSNLEFNREEFNMRSLSDDRSGFSAKITGWLLRNGLIKDESQGNYVLLGVVLLFVLITFMLLWNLSGQKMDPAVQIPQHGQPALIE